jgi:3-polyprenyl-4-hydroxybenzoate decarboxylase
MQRYGFSEQAARRFIERELERAAPSSSFYWESDEVEDLLDLIVGVVAKLIEANNVQLSADWQDRGAKDLRL